MALVERILLIPCPACRERIIPPPPDSVRPWSCPFCGRRFRRKLRASDSSGIIPCFGLFSKQPWPPDRWRMRRPLWHPARWASLGLAAYAALLLLLMLVYHVAMTLLATAWLVVRAPALLVGALEAAREPGDGPYGSPWLDPLRSWLPHFQRYDPDLSIGPTLSSEDAPGIFVLLAEVASKLGAAPPDEIRLTYLPCCGVLEQRRWGGLRGGRRVLVIGLPLLYVLSIEELRAALAHELAHLSRGDAALACVLSQFLGALDQAILAGSARRLGWLHPCALFAGTASWFFRVLASPLSRHQEHRADALAASLCGSDVVARSLRTVALVQPVFKEVLCHYHPSVVQSANLYHFFRAAWNGLGDELKEEMAESLACDERLGLFALHPTLRARLAQIGRHPPHPEPDARPARRLLADRVRLEDILHDYIYSVRTPHLSVFLPHAE